MERLRAAVSRVEPGAVALWAIPVVLIVYLSLRDGGFDLIPRGEVGIVVWWAVLIGAAAGVLATDLGNRWGRLLVVLLCALFAWTAIGLTWTESSERTMVEVSRVAAYLGVLVLVLSLPVRDRWRWLLAGTTTGVAVVIVLAAASRMLPELFPEPIVGQFFADLELERRLAYPLGYSTGLTTLCAIGLPMLIWSATSARIPVARLLAIAVVPIAILALWLTGSSLSLPLAGVGLLAYLFLTDERPRAVAALVLGAIGGAVLMLATNGRDALDRGLVTPEATTEGRELLFIALVVVAITVGLHWLLNRGFDSGRLPSGPLLSQRTARGLLLGGVLVVIVAVLAAGGAGRLSDEWESFKSPDGIGAEEGSRSEQVLDVSSRGRYEYWQAAVEANETEPLTGIGPGTYEFYWAREGTGGGAIFIRDAHSLYLEALAELGIPGLLLVLAFVIVLLAAGSVRAWRMPAGTRGGIAAAAAGCWVFAAAAAVDWMWELGALAIVFFILAAIAVAGGRTATTGELAAEEERSRSGSLPERLLICGLAVVSLIAIAIPLAAASSVERSRDDVAEGNLDDALEAAEDAAAIEPYAATPRLQQALVLEELGDFAGAVEAAELATEKESTNWRTWLILSRLEARNGDAQAAVDAYAEAQSLFPRFVQPPEPEVPEEEAAAEETEATAPE